MSEEAFRQGHAAMTECTVTLLAACAHCRQLIYRGSNEGQWRTLPEPGKQLWPARAARCPARAGALPHQSPVEPDRLRVNARTVYT